MKLKLALTIVAAVIAAAPNIDWSFLPSIDFGGGSVEVSDDTWVIPEPAGQYAAIARSVELAMRDDLKREGYEPGVAIEYAEFFAGCVDVLDRSPDRLNTLSAFAAFRGSAGFLHFADLEMPAPELRKAYDSAAREVWGVNEDNKIDDRKLTGADAEKLGLLLQATAWGCYRASIVEAN